MRAKLNVIGPNGERILAGQDIPEDWPEEFRESLLAGGGAEQEPKKGKSK